jgi:hypothetical protein
MHALVEILLIPMETFAINVLLVNLMTQQHISALTALLEFHAALFLEESLQVSAVVLLVTNLML